jgi:pectinesterase
MDSEKVTIPYTKPYIICQGAGKEATVISWNDRASSMGTANSATFYADANSFIARGIGFKVCM